MKVTVKLSLQSNIDHYGTSIVELDMEEYIKGVVPAEIGNAHIEACKAQAVAARTFAFIKASKGKQLTDQSSKDQAFKAVRISSSYPNAMRAVEETAGQVLYYNGQLITTSSYSNANGGRVKSAKEVWGSDRPWLISKPDPYNGTKTGGHGVGMSQTGAKNMAAQGFSYKDILAFYYVGTEIRNNFGEERVMTKAEKVASWTRSKVGCGYVYGATGQKATESSVQALIKSYGTSNIDYSVVKKWIDKGVQVYDCAGLVSEAMSAGGLPGMSTGATSQWNKTTWLKRGTIDTLPKDKVCCLYRQVQANPVKMQHTGIYLGDGTFIDSRDSTRGVIGPNKLSTYKWTHWGIPKGLYSESDIDIPEVIKVAYQAKVTASSGSTVNMRQTPSSNGALISKIGLGQIVDVTSVSGDWSAITWNGKSGYMMSKFLKKVEGSESNKVWYVRLECDSEEQAKAIAQILAKAKATT